MSKSMNLYIRVSQITADAVLNCLVKVIMIQPPMKHTHKNNEHRCFLP